MGLITPGYLHDTYYPDRYWMADYWAESIKFFLRGAVSMSEPLVSDISMSEPLSANI